MYKFNVFILVLLAILASMGSTRSSASSDVIADTNLNGVVLTMQNMFCNDPTALATLGVANNAITVNGSALLQGKSQDMDSYLAATYSDISAQFAHYITSHNLNGSTDYVVLDMESVVAPKHWGGLLTEDEDDGGYDNTTPFVQVINAYKLRVEVARALLPDAKICLFGMPNPTNTDFTSTSWLQQIAGYTHAGQLGVFDQADYIVPVCYMRYCAADSVIYVQHNQDMLTNSVQTGQTLTNSNGSHMSVFPYITVTLFNGGSDCNNTHISAADLWQQITWIKSLNVENFGVWIGNATIPASLDTIPEYFNNLLQAANQNSSGL